MTEKKQLPEQMASHTYRRQEPARTTPRPASRRESSRESSRVERREATYTLRRVVTIPEADPSKAWNTFAQRQKQMRRARSRPQRYVESTRTFAQTGMRASSGRMKAVRRSLPQYHSSPVPARSGRRPMRRGFLWKLLSLFALVALLVLATSFAFTSNAFRIEQVNVVGTHNDALIHNIQRMGMQGQNIFLVNVVALASRIQAFPRVASVNLSKQWPNQLTVTVVERTPALLWQTGQGTYSVDSQGVVIAPANQTTGVDHLYTVIDARNQGKGRAGAGQLIQPGARLNQADIAFAVDVFTRLPQVTGINAFTLRYDGTINANDIHSGEAGSRGSFVVESQDGWIAYLGGAGDANPLDNRLVELQQILAFAQKQQLRLASVDLRYGLRPVYTLKS